jgi:omega-amidase
MLVRRAADCEAEIVCFPEHWLGVETSERVSDLIEYVRDLARRFNITIIAGGLIEHLSDGIFVTAPVVDQCGRLVGRQKKIHLFGGEKAKATPGSEYQIFESDKVKFGVMVCYDAVFPETARIFALKGAEMLFVPSRILKTGIQPWHLYLTTRCLENRLPIVAANVVYPPRYLGHSIILDVKEDAKTGVVHPTALSTGGESFEAILSEVNIQTSRELREARLKERRPSTYGLLSEL